VHDNFFVQRFHIEDEEKTNRHRFHRV
jgi:hypothetical protein